uniref:Prenylated Rab acceptor protein 1 n=1 Tax=Ascaris lumbricoides TaxID=6252 RepID=A0A9J2PBG4_ASCLU
MNSIVRFWGENYCDTRNLGTIIHATGVYIEHMTQTSNSTTSAESIPAANAPASEQQEEPQGSRDVEVGGQERARRTCASSFSEFVRSWKTAIRPWSEFFRGSNISLPPCLDGYVTRVKRNLVYFVGNYFAVTTVLLLCSIITSFWLLVSTIILCMLIYMIRARTVKGPIKIGEEEVNISDSSALASFSQQANGPTVHIQQLSLKKTPLIPSWILYAGAIFITLPLFIFAHVGYIIYCAVGASIVLILLHATFYTNEQENKSDEDIGAETEMTESAQMTESGRLPVHERPIVRIVETKTRVRFDEEEST